MPSELVEKIAKYIKAKTLGDPSGHDWYHIERVLKMARYLQSKEGGELELIEILALMHNLGDRNIKQPSSRKGSLVLHGIMDILEIEEPLKSKIIKLVNEIRFGGIDTKPPSTIEARIVQDANFLDYLGAIGVARQFVSGGFHGRPIYDPKIKVREKLRRDEYEFQKQKGTSVNSLFEKSLWVAKMMNTETAKRMAEKKAEYVEKFIEQFLKEWKGKDLE